MNTVILDPHDPSKAVIGSFSEQVFGSYVEGGILGNIHSATVCADRPCVIHNPSNHSMREFDLHWRDDRGIFERTCPHGVGHPDPDQFEFYKTPHQNDSCQNPYRGEVVPVFVELEVAVPRLMPASR